MSLKSIISQMQLQTQELIDQSREAEMIKQSREAEMKGNVGTGGSTSLDLNSLDGVSPISLIPGGSQETCSPPSLEVDPIPSRIQICPISPSVEQSGTKYELTVDSGAGKSVAPKSMARGYKVRPSPGSIRGQKFVGPGDETYANEGEVTLDMVNAKGQECCGEFQIAEGLTKPLAAVSDCCDKDNLVLFDKEDPCMIHRDSPEGRAIREIMRKAAQKLKLERKNGVYVTPIWVMPPKESPFQRRG